MPKLTLNLSNIFVCRGKMDQKEIETKVFVFSFLNKKVRNYMGSNTEVFPISPDSEDFWIKDRVHFPSPVFFFLFLGFRTVANAIHCLFLLFTFQYIVKSYHYGVKPIIFRMSRRCIFCVYAGEYVILKLGLSHWRRLFTGFSHIFEVIMVAMWLCFLTEQ